MATSQILQILVFFAMHSKIIIPFSPALRFTTLVINIQLSDLVDAHSQRLQMEHLFEKSSVTNVRKELPIPLFINDYNHFIGGVDIADQLRSYYSTQRTSFRNWYPLFF